MERVFKYQVPSPLNHDKQLSIELYNISDCHHYRCHRDLCDRCRFCVCVFAADPDTDSNSDTTDIEPSESFKPLPAGEPSAPNLYTRPNADRDERADNHAFSHADAVRPAHDRH